MHAMQLEILKDYLGPGKRGLDIGSGSGYITACMARMVGPTGRVVGIDHVPELVKMSIDNVNRDDAKLISTGIVELICGTLHSPPVLRHALTSHLPLSGDGRQGSPKHAPFDAIHVGAAAPRLPPALTEQLAPGASIHARESDEIDPRER